jgi:hypothetical protein
VGVLTVLVLTSRPAVVVLSDVVGLSVVVVVVGSVVVVVLDVVLLVVLDVVLLVVVLDVVLLVVLDDVVLGFVRPVVTVGFLGVVTLGHVQAAARVAEFPFVLVGDPAVSLAKAAVAETRKADPTSTLTSPRPSLRRKLPVRPIPHPPCQEPAVEQLAAKLSPGAARDNSQIKSCLAGLTASCVRSFGRRWGRASAAPSLALGWASTSIRSNRSRHTRTQPTSALRERAVQR